MATHLKTDYWFCVLELILVTVPVSKSHSIYQKKAAGRLLKCSYLVCISCCKSALWLWIRGFWLSVLWASGKDTLEASDSSRILSSAAGTHPTQPYVLGFEVWEELFSWEEVEEEAQVCIWEEEGQFWIWSLACFSLRHQCCWACWILPWKQGTSDNSTLRNICKINKQGKNKSHQFLYCANE